jgi:hypothetical protein
MTTFICPREHDVRDAAASGRWPVDLAEHAEKCDVCREVRLVTSALAETTAPPPATVEPRALFACARHVRRINVESRISFIVTFTQAIALIGAAALLLSWVSWSDVARVWTDTPGRNAWIFVTAAAGLAGAVGLSRWLREEES